MRYIDLENSTVRQVENFISDLSDQWFTDYESHTNSSEPYIIIIDSQTGKSVIRVYLNQKNTYLVVNYLGFICTMRKSEFDLLINVFDVMNDRTD